MITNKTSKQHYRTHDPGCVLTKIKDAFYSELGDFKSIFEFGCNNGCNLIEIQKRYPNMIIDGIDLNKQVVERARIQGKEFIEYGDEFALQFIPSKSYDVVFTSSVLCHLPRITEIVEQLKRIAIKKVVLLETNDIMGRYYFEHKYSALGFKIKRSIKNPDNPIGNGAIYDQWE